MISRPVVCHSRECWEHLQNRRFDEAARRDWALSGGQRILLQRVILIMAKPEIIVLVFLPWVSEVGCARNYF